MIDLVFLFMLFLNLIFLHFKGLAVTTNGAPRSRVGVGTLKVKPPGGTKESTGDQSKYLTEKYKH